MNSEERTFETESADSFIDSFKTSKVAFISKTLSWNVVLTSFIIKFFTTIVIAITANTKIICYK